MATLTAGEVINHARDLHPVLSPTNAPDAIAFRALSRFQRDLYEQIAPRVPAYLATELVVDFPLADFEAGVDLSTLIPGGWKDLTDGYFFYSSSSPNPHGKVRGSFVPWEQRDMSQSLPAYTLRANVLTFLGGEQFYANFATFNLTYTPLPADVTSPSSVFVLPLDAREALAAMLAAFFMLRLVGTPAFDLDAAAAGAFGSMAEAARAAFLTRIWRTTQRQSYRVRDVRGGSGGGP